MTADNLPESLERVYAEAFEGAIVAQESQAEAFRAALLAVYRAGQKAGPLPEPPQSVTEGADNPF